jgi:cyclopentanol dehydrogenase
MVGRLDGKVAIVTGAASGIGSATAKLIAKEGAKVVGTDIQEDSLMSVVQQINEEGKSEAIAIRHDVSKDEDWDTVICEAVKTYGKIDILINNAGVGSLGGRAGVQNLTLSDWEKTLSINLTSQFLGIQKTTPEMRKVGKGSIVNVSSIAGLFGGSFGAAYSASKGGSRLLAKTTAGELGKYNIRVNSVHPGYINTAMSVSPNDPEVIKRKLRVVPLGYIGEPKDIAYGLLFLASDEARYITGTELVIDGGRTGSLRMQNWEDN